MKDISHDIEDWLFRYREGLLTETERSAVERYLAAHPDAQALLASYDPRLRLPHDLPLTDAAGHPLSYPRKEALKRPAAASPTGRPAPAETPAETSADTRQRRLISRRSIWSAAACAALILALGITFVMRFDDPLSAPASRPIAQTPASTPQPLTLALAKTAPPNAPSAKATPSSAKSQSQAKSQAFAQAKPQVQTQAKPAAQAKPAECFEPAEPTKAEPMEVLSSNQLIAYVETPADSPEENPENTPEETPATTVDNLIAYAEPQHNFLHRLASWTGLRRKNELSQGLYAAGDQLEELSASISATWRELQRNPQILGEYAYAYVVRSRENSRENSKTLRADR